MQPNFPTPGCTCIAVKYPKAGPNKGTIEISPNKTLQSLFINVVVSPKIHDPVKAAVIPLNHSIHVTLRRIEKPLGENPHFVSLNIPFFVKGTKKSIFKVQLNKNTLKQTKFEDKTVKSTHLSLALVNGLHDFPDFPDRTAHA